MDAAYVRAVDDFDASHPDEVSLRKGDVVKITKKLDTNCMFGIVHQVEGSFPANCVEPLVVPPVEAGQRIFAAIGNFDGGETGDLCLKKGDIVIGTVAVDQNWWKGFEISTRNVGIFPLTHVEELSIELWRNPSFQDEKSSCAVNVVCEAVVVSSFHAQLEGELDLTKGESIEVLQMLSNGYAFGRCRGKTGKFPLSHIQVRDPESKQTSVNYKSNKISVDKHNSNISHNQSLNSSAISNNGYLKGMKSHARKGSYTQASTTSHDSYVTPYAQANFAFTAVNEGELSFAANEIITLISHINDDWAEGEINGRRGIFPTSYVSIIVDCEMAEDTKPVQAAEVVAGKDSSDMYGRVLCDFVAENSSELSLCEGDTVTILKQVDADWYLARHDDERVGRCPVNHIEVFGCEPLHSVTTPSSVLPGKELSGEPAAVNKISSFSSIGKPKPAVKPKPKLTSSRISHCVSATTSSEHDGTKQNQNFVSEEIRKDLPLSHDSHHALELQMHHTNTRTSLDQAVQFKSQGIGGKMNARVGHMPDHQFFKAVNIQELEATEPFRTKEDSSRMKVDHQSFESPVAMPRVRPNSLGIKEDSKGKADKNTNKPTPLLRPSESRLSAGKPKIVPKRPAPPLPASRTVVQSHSHNDLMMLSPNPSRSSDPLVARRSITPMMQPSMNSPTSPVHPDAVKLRSDSNKQMDKNHSEKRQRVITELVQTESDYVNCLVLCLKTFSSRAQFCPPALDLEMLFGNADEVVELSQRLLGLIEQNVETKPFEMQCVGKCFTELKEQFQQVYALYCRNHDDVIALLEKYEGNAEISKFIQTALDQVRQQMQVFDLHAILIKPVQRILKYPLLLNELERVTEDTHVDKHHLLTAVNAMTCVAAYINEYKRRKDLVFKYKQETDVRFSDKISRLTMHSTMKKLSRISRKMVGIQTVDEVFNHEEQRFKALDSAVRNLTKDISQYIDQCHEVLECRELVTVNIAEFYTKEAPELEIQRLCEIHSQILRDIFQKFREEIESNILPPLNSLLLMYQGPLKVIRKRYDKLLDYDNAAAAHQRNAGDGDQAKALDEELTVARNNYEALNAQLLDDLPKLYSLSMEILLKCLRWFISSQNRFLRNAVDRLQALQRLPLFLGSSSCPNIVEAFNIAHSIAVERMSDLSFITKSFNPQADEVRKMKGRRSTIDGSQKLIDIEGASNQCDGQRIRLKQKYPAEQLFWVCRDFLGAQAMDLVLSAGALVAVIKESDPMGNRDRWFVDNGAEKGFVPKEFLSDKQPSSGVFQKTFDPFEWLGPAGHSESKSSEANDDIFLLPSAGNGCAQLLSPTSSKQTDWVKCDDDPLPSVKPSKENDTSSSNFNDSQVSNVSSDIFYRAVYDFNARSSIELSIKNGEIVHVLQKHDLDGSEQWWEVRREDGQKGYVPANYLYAFYYS